MAEKLGLLFENFKQFSIDNWDVLIAGGITYLFLDSVVHFLWNKYIHEINHKFIYRKKWVLFQMRFPKENLKSPQAMEQVIASLHGTYSYGIPWRRRYIVGEVEDWFVFEMVGRSTGISFYAYIEERFATLFRSAFFAQYPEVEISEVPDYLDELPEVLPNEKYDLTGTDYKLKKDNPYPIKTYHAFEAIDEDKRLDPMATIAEAISNLVEDEVVLFQIIIAPDEREHNPKFEKKAQKIITKLSGRPDKKKHSTSISGEFADFTKKTALAFIESPAWGAKEEEKKFADFRFPTPGESDALKAIETKLTKNLFRTVIRFIYIDRKDAFTKKNSYAVYGAMTQFSERSTNNLAPGDGTFIWSEKIHFLKGSPRFFFKKRRLERRKRLLYRAYRKRLMPAHHRFIGELEVEASVMGVDEIATIFHPPGAPITAIQRTAPVEAKKVGPPLTLPTFD